MAAAPDDAIAFHGALTRSQFALVQRLLLPWWGAMWVTSLWVLLAVVMYQVLGDANPAAHLQPGVTLTPLTWAILTVVGLVVSPLTWVTVLTLAIMWAITAFGRRRQWRDAENTHHIIMGSIGTAGLAWNTAMTTANFPWPKLTHMRQHPDMLLIFYSRRCAFYLPKAFFASEAAWHDANALALQQFSGKQAP